MKNHSFTYLNFILNRNVLINEQKNHLGEKILFLVLIIPHTNKHIHYKLLTMMGKFLKDIRKEGQILFLQSILSSSFYLFIEAKKLRGGKTLSLKEKLLIHTTHLG